MNTDKKDLGEQLAYAALDEIPIPKDDTKEIVGLVKSSGRITGYQRIKPNAGTPCEPPYWTKCQPAKRFTKGYANAKMSSIGM